MILYGIAYSVMSRFLLIHLLSNLPAAMYSWLDLRWLVNSSRDRGTQWYMESMESIKSIGIANATGSTS